MEREKTGRGPNISKEVRQLIISQAVHDSKNMPRRALAVRLQDLIEKMGEISPTEETLIRMISDARNRQPSELDLPWSIGVCEQYNIPPEIIPVLIKEQQLRARSEFKVLQQGITIREARWFARLYPAMEALTRKQFPLDPEERLRFMPLIVSCYAQRERVSELMNEPYLDTSELDRIFFIDEDLSSDALFEAWWSTRSEREQKAATDILEQRRMSVIRELGKSLGRHPTAAETNLINGYFDAALNGPLALREWEKQHPAVQEQKVLRFSWIEIYIEALEGEGNEGQNNQT
jgi:hypothetical protein